MSITDNTIEVKPYSLTELAKHLWCNQPYHENWIVKHNEAMGEKVGRLYNAKQVIIILTS